jgi:hypothetical protein
MKTISLEEKLQDLFSALETIEGVKSVDSILTTLRDRIIFPEITHLILNARFELLYLFEQQKVILLTMKQGIALDSACIKEINLIEEYKNTIESTLNELIISESLHII